MKIFSSMVLLLYLLLVSVIIIVDAVGTVTFRWREYGELTHRHTDATSIIFLLGVCLVVCLVKRNRGGKYAVQEQEVAHGRPDYDDGGHDGGFSEYTQP